jgi:hypothetical protein
VGRTGAAQDCAFAGPRLTTDQTGFQWRLFQSANILIIQLARTNGMAASLPLRFTGNRYTTGLSQQFVKQDSSVTLKLGRPGLTSPLQKGNVLCVFTVASSLASALILQTQSSKKKFTARPGTIVEVHCCKPFGDSIAKRDNNVRSKDSISLKLDAVDGCRKTGTCGLVLRMDLQKLAFVVLALFSVSKS